jgi:asparagine synthase (glutamine-hydrolysing)
MCGLYGSIGFTPDSDRIDLVAHRGPDGRGWRVYDAPAGPVALGHRRLAIIDTSDDGLQPMPDVSGRFHVVFNGEIYNYVELRDELRSKGEAFRTLSDTEVLLRAFMVWGAECLPRLRGMFAFLIWDDREKRLFAARDRFGIKPLYVLEAAGHVAFASEIKQLIALGGTAVRMNVARIHDFLESGILDHSDETMFEGIRQVRGGEYAVVDTANGRAAVTVRRWYDAKAGAAALTEDGAAQRFNVLMEEAVRFHLRSDVPVGSCLSGGLDSSSIVCLMARQMPNGQKVKTVSACYGEKSVDEKPFMDAVVAHAQTDPHFIYPRAEDLFQKASDITWHQDEPFGSTSIFAQWCVFQEARRAGVKVMLDGQGADEQLAGYHFAFPYHVAGLVRRMQFGEAGRTVQELRQMHGISLGAQMMQLGAALMPPPAVALVRSQVRRTTGGSGWLDSAVIRARGNRTGAMRSGVASLGLHPPTDLRSLCLAMTFASNLQMLLHWEDRNSMAHSIEARVPFLDHPLVEFSLALGNDHKIVGADTKRVLRRAMAGVLPSAVVERRDKLGFSTPEQHWFRGPLRGLVHDLTEAALQRYPALFNPGKVRELRDAMLDGRRPVKPELWRIINLGIWGERFAVAL